MKIGAATAFILSFVFLPALASADPITAPVLMSPKDAIYQAASAAPKSVPGVFGLTVRSVGRANGHLFLNSETDYRDQRCLTIELKQWAIKGLKEKLGEAADEFLLGKEIAVRGAARRTKVVFISNGEVTDKYYYQTHVLVDDADQISVGTAAP